MPADLPFTIAHAENFPLELGRMPRNVQNTYYRTVLPALKAAPETSDPPRIKHLNGWKSLWRYRVRDNYRLVYRVDRSDHCVTMLMVDHRGKIYGRLGANPDGSPGIRIVATAEELLETAPSDVEVGNALISLAEEQLEEVIPSPEKQLPVNLNAQNLADWGVPEEHHAELQSANTEGELLALLGTVGEETVELVMNGLWPRKIEEIIQQPVLIDRIHSTEGQDEEENRSLESFLLRLDDTQKSFVARFEGGRPSGPWLLKGGPGSGKSTVAMYCIQALAHGSASELSLDDEPLRILFTTFTNSLTNSSIQLLKALSVEGGRNRISVRTVDKLAADTLGGARRLNIVRSTALRSFSLEAMQECRRSDEDFSFTDNDAEFLEEEIDWVIFGQGLVSAENYLKADRSGRGRQIGQNQRRQIWSLFERLKAKLQNEGLTTFSQRLMQAEHDVDPKFDYVFIDEAQDLKPIAIRFCLGLCKNERNIFLTADTNQSIYGSGMSWTKVASDLNFQGRARVLRRNYRTTSEIWDAITQLAPDGEGTDNETLEGNTVFRGPPPNFSTYTDIDSIGPRLNSFLHEALIQERVSPSCAAVLCPTKREMTATMRILNPNLNPRAMSSSEVDLSHPGVKVLTMHSAKGLQFPVVAVVGLEEGRLPLPVPRGIEPSEHYSRQQRVFFVACSRAMRRLIVFGNKERPSSLVSGISDERWEIE